MEEKDHANGSNTKGRMVANVEQGTTTSSSGPSIDEVEDQQHDPKRVKTDTLLKDVMSEEIIGLDMATIQSKYRHDKPYSYGLLPNLFRPEFLKSCIREIKDNSIVNFKESDLFRVYQSIDLANLDQNNLELCDKMPHTMQLRSVLYSPEWRRWMEDFHQLPPDTLSDQVDCACNCHATGCHLLCHDDVIGTRKISYILYLTDDDWKSSEGGALELYDSVPVPVENSDNDTKTQRRIPEVLPAATVLPQFNHMAMFVVQPGISFHAVQEVLGDRPRLSLQGWYHAATPPENLHYATLQRLKSYQSDDVQREEDTEGDYTPIEYNSDDNPVAAADAAATTPPEMLAADRDFLAQYLHPTYLETSAIRDICAKFEEDSSVQLCHFLNDVWVEKLKGFASSADTIPERDLVDPTNSTYYQWGVSTEWQTVGPSHKQRFLEYVPPCGDTVSLSESAAAPESSVAIRMGRALYELKTQLLQSTAFARYLGRLTSLGLPTAHRGRVRRFRPGRDYTVAHYGLLTKTSVLDATLCFAAGSGGEDVLADKDDCSVNSGEMNRCSAKRRKSEWPSGWMRWIGKFLASCRKMPASRWTKLPARSDQARPRCGTASASCAKPGWCCARPLCWTPRRWGWRPVSLC